MLSIYQRERLDRAALRARSKREYNGALRPADNARRIHIRTSPTVRRLLGAIVVLVIVLVIVLVLFCFGSARDSRATFGDSPKDSPSVEVHP